MSRGENVRVGSRQNPDHYLQMPEPARPSKSGKKKTTSERKAPSQKPQSSNGVGVPKQLSLRDLVRVPPCYPPDIEHLAFRQLNHDDDEEHALADFPSKISRRRLAEMFALGGGYQPPTSARERKEKKGWADSVGVDGGAGHHHRPVSDTTSREPASRELYRLGASTNVDIVHAAVLNFKSLRKSERRSLDALDHDEMTSTRGQNVSILHLRGPPEPWDPPVPPFANAAGSMRSASKVNSFQTSCGTIVPFQNEVPAAHETKLNGTLSSNPRKRDTCSSNSVSLFIAGGVNSSVTMNSASRELSPVRWCDREVDGVYLGRSGWVQVHQRSLDENRRYTPRSNNLNCDKIQPVVSTLPSRIKLSNYHYNSESETLSDVRKERPRPDCLPLPIEINRSRNNQKTPSPILQEYESLSPPSLTPIISPPPAFQDPGSESNFPASQPSRNLPGKPPLLSRSKVVLDCESPPCSPSNWNSRGTSSLQRYKKLMPPPAPSQQRVLLGGHTKSLDGSGSSGTRRNQFQRFVESSTSSSSSSFGFRSLDGSVGRSSTMPRLNETDSSVDGYDEEDFDEEWNRPGGRLRSPPPPPDSFLNGEKKSPNPVRHRNAQRSHPGRRTPSSEANGKKYGARSSSSSESCSSCERKSPNFRRYNPRQSRGDAQSSSWDVRNSRVRRSRSLQLPEKRSPNVAGMATPSSSGGSREHLSPEYPIYPNYRTSGTNSSHAGPYRVVVKVNGEAMNMGARPPRRFMPKKAQSEEARYDELRRETEEETRIITEYLNSTRSRAAARDLLIHRYLNRPEEASKVSAVSPEIAADPLHSVYFSGNRKPSQKKPPKQRNSENYASPLSGNPCNPSICDFWPHCSHGDEITYSNPVTSSIVKYAQSYPSQNQRKPEKSRKEEKQGKEHRSSVVKPPPVSAELANDFGKESRKPGSSLRSSPDTRLEKRPSPAQRFQRPNGENAGVREDFGRKGKYGTNRERSSSSTSSGEVYAAVSERVGKNSKNGKIFGVAKSALERSKSPSRKVHGAYSQRPGSAPTDGVEEDAMALDAQRRSLSLPKSFLSNGFRNSRQSGLFPWRRQFVSSANTSPGLRPLTPEMSKTAPATPVRDAGTNNKEKERVKQTQYIRSSSAPFLDDTPDKNPGWDSRRDISQATEEVTKESNPRTNQKEILGQRNNLASQTSESVLQKFKKSFSLRFHKSQKGSTKDDSEDVDYLAEDVNEEESPTAMFKQKNNNDGIIPGKEEGTYDPKFKIGPLVWRSSKERKKAKKAVRSAKCNSGDSGIQIEGSLHVPGDSSESHDTDQHDELDSPPMIRRRAASREKSSRPQSEVINQILIDKFKADLQWRAQAKGYPNRRVRRTNSDLGGQRLFNWELRNSYRRMLSTPSPVKGRPSRMSSGKASPDVQAVSKKRLPGRSQLRRSMSQPLGLNELSPLMRRKPSVVRNQILSEDEHDGRGGTSDDEALSDSESSVTSLNDRKKSFEAAMEEEVVILAEAVWDHVAMEPEELAFRAGEVIEVLDTLDRDWWWGSTGDNYGWFPSAFVRLRVSQEDTVEDCLEAIASGTQTSKQLRRRTSISLLSNDQVRSSVVRELLNTERDFVKVLRDVTEGYMTECRRRTDMFSPTQIETIFGNLEDLLLFQTKFLEDLEVRVDKDAPHRSCVGEIFLKHRSGFRMYSEYCNSHPMAIATLQELYQRNNYNKFFEACRLMRGLIEIPLDGYLLTPIQRICKYPLQLAELLKYTKPDHPDHFCVKEALETMRGVAVLINERKRRMESLEKLAAWQQRVEGWEGEDLIEVSTQLIYQGEAVRVTSGMWTSNVTLFLFDHQLVYCKKDLLKRNTYVYKGRICMDTSEVINITDGKDPQSGVTIRHGLKIYSCIRDKWLLFCCRNGEEKSKWLDALAEERKLVAQDRQSGLELPPAARHLARMAARSKRRPPIEPRGKAYKRQSQYNGYKVGRKMGTWFTFGGAKKTGRANLRSRNPPQHVT